MGHKPVSSLSLIYRSTKRMLTPSISALGVAKNIALSEEDDTIVRNLLHMNNITVIPSSMVTMQPKIIIGSQTIFSKSCKRVKKRNSFTVAYSDPQAPNQLKYGQVQKFLSCPADSPNALHIAIIEQLRVKDGSDSEPTRTTHSQREQGV